MVVEEVVGKYAISHFLLVRLLLSWDGCRWSCLSMASDRPVDAGERENVVRVSDEPRARVRVYIAAYQLFIQE